MTIDQLKLESGLYAVTGLNGCGKSSLFNILMSCKTNSRPIDLPSSISIALKNDDSYIRMPSGDVTLISQSTYWPLHARPIDWILHKDANDIVKVNGVLSQLKSLKFFNDVNDSIVENATGLKDLMSEKVDWFAEISGGQKSKVREYNFIDTVLLPSSNIIIYIIKKNKAELVRAVSYFDLFKILITLKL